MHLVGYFLFNWKWSVLFHYWLIIKCLKYNFSANHKKHTHNVQLCVSSLVPVCLIMMKQWRLRRHHLTFISCFFGTGLSLDRVCDVSSEREVERVRVVVHFRDLVKNSALETFGNFARCPVKAKFWNDMGCCMNCLLAELERLSSEDK